MTPIDRGRLAQAVLENEVFQEAFDTIRRDIYTQWQASDNPQDREALHLSNKLMDRLQSVFKQAVANGDIELKILDRKQTLAERIGLK